MTTTNATDESSIRMFDSTANHIHHKRYKEIKNNKRNNFAILFTHDNINMPKRKSTSPQKNAKKAKKVQEVTADAPSSSDEATKDFSKMKIPELKAELKKLGLKRGGKKADLLQRLLDAQKK